MNTAATRGLERIVTMLRQAGAGDVDAMRSRQDLQGWLDILRKLGRLGARFPPHAIGGAVESLSGSNFAFMMELGTRSGPRVSRRDAARLGTTLSRSDVCVGSGASCTHRARRLRMRFLKSL